MDPTGFNHTVMLIKAGPRAVNFSEAVQQIGTYFKVRCEAGKNDIRLPQECPDEDKDGDSKDDPLEIPCMAR